MSDTYWKHVWPCSEVLGDFVARNEPLFRGSTVIELSAGATGIPGITACKCGSKLVILTENSANQEALELLTSNCKNNQLTEGTFSVQGLDWESILDLDRILEGLTSLDIILASDVFFDPTVFEVFINAVSRILNAFPNAQLWFTFEERDSEWSIEDLLLLKNLRCSRISKVECHHKTIHIGTIDAYQGSMESTSYFAGIEGGATHSQLVILDKTGKKHGEWSHDGLNYYLEGFEKVANEVAVWIRSVKKELRINGPLGAVGMGLSGAEDEAINRQIVDILKKQHADVANEFYLTTDSVITIAATFSKGGIVLIAGTGSTARLLKADGTVCGVGGWGHQIGDGGSGHWIANKMIRCIFEDDDGLNPSPYAVATVKQLMLDHFKIKSTVEMLDLLYAKFDKANIASFAGKLVKEAPTDPMVKMVFHEAGVILGNHIRAISRHCDKEMLKNVPVVLVGSVFKSWPLLKNGFERGLHEKKSGMRKVTLYLLHDTPAVGAALLAAHNVNVEVPHQQTSDILDTIDWN